MCDLPRDARDDCRARPHLRAGGWPKTSSNNARGCPCSPKVKRQGRPRDPRRWRTRLAVRQGGSRRRSAADDEPELEAGGFDLEIDDGGARSSTSPAPGESEDDLPDADVCDADVELDAPEEEERELALPAPSAPTRTTWLSPRRETGSPSDWTSPGGGRTAPSSPSDVQRSSAASSRCSGPP